MRIQTDVFGLYCEGRKYYMRPCYATLYVGGEWVKTRKVSKAGFVGVGCEVWKQYPKTSPFKQNKEE